VEVIAIRLATPVVGSSMTLTGVMLGVVLFALSAGYWHGGELSSRWDKSKIQSAVARNLLLAGAIYAAISFPCEALLLGKVLDWDFGLGLAIGLSATVLFVLPVYLASQTVPMLAELTNTEGKAGKASGKILFFSTLGSVGGGIITPIFLFPHVGVQATTYMVSGLLVIAALLIVGGKRWTIVSALAAIVAVSLAHVLTKPPANVRFEFDSPHQSIRVVEKKNDNGRLERVMYLNGGRASGVYSDTRETSFVYVTEADQALAVSGSESVLAIGSAGFTFPRDAAAMPFVKQVDAVDVDPEVYRIAESEFLLQRLPAKIHFYPMSGRDALRRFLKTGKRYGFTLLDAYSGMGIPDELLTLEFLGGIRSISERTAANIIMDREVESEFALNALATFRKAFGRAWIKDVFPGDSDRTNILVTNWPHTGSKEWMGVGTVYTDNRTTADRDHVNMVWGSE
jgi:predicted membrane-bound spermidine synthase